MRINTPTLGLILLWHCCTTCQVAAQAPTGEGSRVVVENQGWQLVGNLLIPPSDKPLPAVLMLNKAAGDRNVYRELARQLSARGVASLRLDLRGHGESVNLGRFVPGEVPRSPLIWDSDADVVAAHEYLKAHSQIDGDRIAVWLADRLR